MSNSNILIVTCVFPPEPIVSANLSFDIANELSKNHNVTVLAPFPSRPNGMRFDQFNYSNYRFVLKRLNSYISYRSTIFSRFKESYSFGLLTRNYIKNNYRNIDIIYMNTWPLLAQFYTAYTAKKYSIPLITHIQDIYPESLSQKLPLIDTILNFILLPIDKYITSNSRSLITISNSMKELLVKSRNLPNEKVSVVFNWQDESKFKINSLDEYCTKDEYFTFMFLGSLNILANIESLVFAFKHANIKNSRLVIAGEGPEKNNLINFIKKNNIRNVSFLSFDSNEVGKVQSTSDVLIVSLTKGSSSLAFPSKIPAYMFSSRPIIAYVDIPSDIANTISKANCGWVVQSGKIEELIQCMKNSFKVEKKELINMGISGREYADSFFSRSSNLNKIVSIIHRNLL
jgi:glycosyltransferase involved in cell wall biosynthesis